jgi:polysaccharide deacetylase 2 family uncharacterized protein YibQ
LLQHRASLVRAAFAVALLGAFWLYWPGPGPIAPERRSPGEPRFEERVWAGGLVSAAQAGIAVSAKGHLSGAAPAGRDYLEGRLREVAGTVPTRALPDLPASGGLTVQPAALAREPATDLAAAGPGAAPEMAALAPAEPAAATLGAPAPRAARPAPPPARPRAAEEPETALPEAGPHALAPAALVAPEVVPGQTPAWLRNAVVPVLDDRPAIAIVIDDLGVNRKGTQAVSRLQAPLTLSFLPYAHNLGEQTRAARAAGHELMLHMPMEPVGDDFPGPNALLSSLGPDQLLSRLRSYLQSFPGFVGANNHMGSLLTADSRYMSLVMAELRRHGLLFLDSRTTPRSVAAREARRLNMPYAERDVFLDNEIDRDAVRRQLARLERIARDKGYAVAIGHPHDVTIAALRAWLPALDARGFALVPISAIVARRACAEGAPALHDPCTRYTAIASLEH